MKNLDTLIKERGIKHEHIMKELGISRGTYYRKKNNSTFTYPEIRKIIQMLNTEDKPCSFEDL